MEKAIRPKYQIISGSGLKMIAMTAMLIDHITLYFLRDVDAFQFSFFAVGQQQVTMYYILRSIGRLAFPLYCFLLAEGFAHTKRPYTYGFNLLLFALISELPWNFIHSGGWLYAKQNVFFTLFFGYCALYLLEYMTEHLFIQLGGILFLFVWAYFFNADYSYMGIAAILAMHLLKKWAVARATVCTCLFSATWRAGLAFIPIAFYNGERGFIRGKVGKYLCYAFYPLHLTVLGILKFYVFA